MNEMNKEDKELDEMFHGEEKPLSPGAIHITLGKAAPKKEATKREHHKTTHDYKDGKWEPVKEPNWMDNLKGCAKWVIGFGGLSFLLFYWELAGLMAESIAVPCMCLCTALAGWGVGKNATR